MNQVVDRINDHFSIQHYINVTVYIDTFRDTGNLASLHQRLRTLVMHVIHMSGG